ncbi:MAG TPA: hypothetical protein VHC44_08360 [Verrucomicrobiae bacterium]|nr:hypothetical protein [Verrucomicrobiae bacterium]
MSLGDNIFKLKEMVAHAKWALRKGKHMNHSNQYLKPNNPSNEKLKICKIFWATLTVLLMSMVFAAAGPVEIWISPTGSGGGTGTPDDPYSTPDADSFFNLINDQRPINGTNGPNIVIPEYSTIHLMPGTFLVREGLNDASKARHPITMKEGWKIRGAGMDVTVLELVTNSQALFGKINVIAGTAVTTGSSWDAWSTPLRNAEVSDLTVDCNLQNQSSAQCINAIAMSGTHNKISRVKAVNWGSTAANSECFLFNMGPHSNLSANEPADGLIEDCVAVQPAQVTHACDTIAFCAGNGSDDTRPAAWKIRGCLARDITGGTGVGQPNGFFAAFGGGNCCEVSDSVAYNLLGAAVASYGDTVTYHDVTFRNNRFLNVSKGIVYNGSGNHATNFTFMNNIITCTNDADGVGISLYVPTNSMRGVRIEGNLIYPGVDGASMSSALGLNAVNGEIAFSADNNVLDAGPGGVDYFTSGPNQDNLTVISFRNNVNLRNQPLRLGDSPFALTYRMKGFYDEEYKFTPTSSGWYRIAPRGHTGARIELWSTDTYLDIGLAFQQPGGQSALGELTQLYNSTAGGGQPVPYMRLASYSDGTDFVEGYISTNQVGHEISVRLSGMFRGPVSDFVAALSTATPISVLQLDIGPGIRTTGPLYAGIDGGTVQQITDSSGHIEPAALSIVQPAYGGLGQDASSVTANHFPYTTSTGTFGFGSLTSYTLSLLNSPDVATAQSTLQLVPGTQVQPYDSKLSAMASSPVTSTEFGYLSGVSSSIQTQLNGKQSSLGYTPVNKAGDTMSGSLGIPLGSASAPSLYDVSDPSTGLFFVNGISIGVGNSEKMRLDGGGVTIGAGGPSGFFGSSSFYGLDIAKGAGVALLLGSDNNNTGTPPADNTFKVARVASMPYSSTQLPVAMMFAQNSQFNSELDFGGNAFAMAAATELDFFTAGTTNVPAGTLRWRINNAGTFAAGSDNTYDIGASGARPRNLLLGGGVTAGNLATDKVLVSDASQNVTNSAVTSTELSYLSGATNNVQNQLNILSTSGQQKMYKTADQSIGTTASDVTGLSFPVAANKDYAFEFTIVVTNSGTGKGYELAFNGPSSPTELTAKMEVPAATGNLPAAGVAYGVNTYGTFVGPTSSGPGTARVIATVSGTLRNGATPGTFSVQAISVGASSTVTIKQGSWGYYWLLN